MNWQHFQTYNEASTKAFESMSNQLFELWCRKAYIDSLETVTIVNGSGGDGGVESFATLKDGTYIGMQAKWFLNSISTGQFSQIKNSITTALRVRPLIKKYIVCIPRDLSSDRIGKGNKVVENTELNRWQVLKDSFKADHPELEIELWGDTQIQSLLQNSDAAGIFRFWFEKSEISIELIEYSYEKQKSGWLSQKYTPFLHIQGQIQKNILRFVGRLEERQSSISILSAISLQCRKFLKACNDYLQFVQEHSSQVQLIKEIQRIQGQVIKLLDEVKIAINALNNDQQVISEINEYNWYIDFTILLDMLKQNEQIRENYFHINEIKKTARALQENEIQTIISDIHFQLDNKKYLILGNPGSGKTHGIANLVDSLLNEKLHMPILIRAKDVNPNNNWVDIMKRSLGLATVWNETELWQALESLSYRLEINNISTASKIDPKIIPKILICIDGIDESKPYDLWCDRLREIETICNKYPRLRFCVTSRPYVFRELAYNDSLLSNRLLLPSDGDVPVNVLFKEYTEYFHVNIEGCSWVKWSLKTPLALRVFCENYKNKSISHIDKSSITITNLLSHKFNLMEKEFNSKYVTGYSDKDCIVQKSLIVIARKFLKNTNVYRNDIIDSLDNVTEVNTDTYDHQRELIDFIEDYGILQSYSVNSSSILEPQKTYYSIGIQSFFDYLLALIIIDKVSNPSEIEITDALVNHEGALQMLSIILLEDYGYLIADNRSFKDKLSNGELFDLVCFALSNVSPDSASKRIKEFTAVNTL